MGLDLLRVIYVLRLQYAKPRAIKGSQTIHKSK
jgi:hypothetical protein